jgi:aspartate carbamoyltransferase catalytic subunit
VSLLGRDLVAIDDLTDDEVRQVLHLAKRFSQNSDDPRDLLRRHIIATAFFEPSTRTRLSFESAAHRLGGNVIGFSDPASTSTKKGESLEDTARTISQYADLIVMRHSEAGTARRFAHAADIPVINAGDGPHQHPTQALLDLYTIQEERGRPDDHKIALVGDLKNGRTVHSLAVLLARFGNRLEFVAPDALQIPAQTEKACRAHGATLHKTTDLKKAVQEADIVYMTRLQTERFTDPQEAKRLQGTYTLTPALLEQARPDITIMHPLPRVDELPHEIDARPGAAYFRQAKNGVWVRMSLLTHILTEKIP